MRSAGQLKSLFETYGQKVAFYVVYIREAHPVDGARPNRTKIIEDPISTAERREVASTFCKDLDLKMPCLLDEIDDAVGKAYDASPDRLYLIGEDGKVAYAGGRGPSGFDPEELKEAITAELKKNEKE